MRKVLIKGAAIVSMDPRLGTLPAGDILVDGGRIEAVAPSIDNWLAEPIDGSDFIAIPGFVNGHLHLWQAGVRAIAADWTLDHYFQQLIGKLVRRYAPEDAHIGNLMGALDQINNGVTTIFDWCHIVNSPAHADAALDGLLDSGIRAVFAYGTPMWLFGTKEPHPADAARMRRSRLSSDEGLVTMALAIRGTDFAPGTAEADIRFARDLGLIASFHVACAKHGPRPQRMQSLAGQRLLGPDVNLVHANFLDPDEFKVLAEHGSTVSITPEVEMMMGLGLPPTGHARTAGARINLGTDVVTGVGGDMFTQMRFLLQTHRALANDVLHRQERMPERLDMTAREVLEIATLRGAECFGLGNRVGSITPGKAADIVLLRRTDLNLCAIADPVAAVVLHATVANVDTVLINGAFVKRNGRLTRLDLQQRRRELEASSRKLQTDL
jgi:5-methylthioadenosine/S-adenosylhomocysteine deaminase